jgi:hypothetical protein
MAAPTSNPPLLPFDCQQVGACIALANQVLRRGEEVVEHVLLPVQHPGAVPRLTVLAAAAQVGQREDPAVVEQRKVPRVVGWRAGDVESAVAAQQDRPRAVAREAGAVHEKHGDPGAVSALEPHLGCLIPMWISSLKAGATDRSN